MGNHALLSASSSERWLHCPPSARLGESYDDIGSDYAREGTCAHELCEYKLKKALGMEAADPTENLDFYNAEMEACADEYAAYGLELYTTAKQTCSDPVALIEQRLDFSKYVESGYGTGDFVLIADGTLYVTDFKYGVGVMVSAEQNPQMMLYGLGAIEMFDALYDIDTICILENDQKLQNICFNQLADGMEIKGEVPWQHPARFWRDADDAQLICYVDANYGNFSARNYQIGVAKVVDDRSYHPIREFFAGLPQWDGKSRVETLLIDYLGADDNAYTRAVTRKTICAGVARIKQPGIKFDYIPVLNGPQGIGKSTLIERLGGEWYSDSLSLTDMNDKTAAEKLQGYWILEIGELAGMKKADIDKVKAFISRQDDKYRASFGRRVTPHPRQCIFFGTTNSQNGYLRDITGNRRFWTVKTPGTGRLKPWQLTKEDVRQVWAEALVLVERGEKLYLDSDLEAQSQVEQSAAMEQDDREGLVTAYLDLLLPENWADMDIYARQEYIRDPDAPVQPKGMVRRDAVSNLEIWCECFGKRKEDIKPADSYAIAAMMLHIEGWHKTDERKTQPLYGQQRLYRRV